MGCVSGNPATSNKIKVKVNDKQPVSISIVANKTAICDGDSVQFTAIPVNEGPNQKYQWFVNNIQIPGKSSKTFSSKPINGDVVYAVLSSDLDCVTGNPAVSNKITIAISGELPVSVSVVANKKTVCEGDSVTFSATPVNGGKKPVYAWFVNEVEIGGVTGASFPYLPKDNDEVYARLTSVETCVIVPVALSNKITIRLTGSLTASVKITADTTEMCYGDSVLIKANPVNGGKNPAFAWFVNGKEIAGENDSTFIYVPNNGDEVYTRLTSGEICVTDPMAISNKIIFSVNSNVIAKVTLPVLMPVCENQPVTITANTLNGGANPAYTWFVNNIEQLSQKGSTLRYIPKNNDRIFVTLVSDSECVKDKKVNSNEIVVNVGDTVPPVAVCSNITVYLDAKGKASITTSQIDKGTIDNCKLDTLYLSRYNLNCSDIGTNRVTLTAIDAVGLTDTCWATVTVIDTIKPFVECSDPFEIQLDKNAQYELTIGEILVSAFDSCGIDTMYVFPRELTCDNIGPTAITLWVVGANRDTAYCQTQATIYGNRAPVVTDDKDTTFQNVPAIINVVDNDFDEKTSIDISSLAVSLKPQHGTISVNNITGDITYTPDLNFSGTDVFQYSICDDGIPCEAECGKAYVYVTVLTFNEPPIVSPDFFSTGCLSVEGNLLENDRDPDSDNLTINTAPLNPVNHGILSIGPDGNFTYYPNVGFVGIDSFEYVVCDNGIPQMCDTVKVKFNVNCSGEEPGPQECILFIPEGFSPNGDGILDYFRITCIEPYPNAKLMIFNRNGNLLWQKENYGNYQVWGDPYNAWWWGTSALSRTDIGRQMVNGEPKLKVGNYVYVLQLGNGDVKNGVVLISY